MDLAAGVFGTLECEGARFPVGRRFALMVTSNRL